MTRERLIAATGPAILLIAAFAPPLRPAEAALLAAGWLLLRFAGRAEAITWAAVLPLGLALSWPWIAGSDLPLGEDGCVAPLSVIVLRRLALVAIVLAAVAVLGVAHRATAGELGLRGPGVGEAALAVLGCVVLAVGGLIVGPAVARPFFGELDFPVPPAALAPALLFGLANGVSEEVAYRGAMQAWLARAWPLWAAIGYQGLLFGIVHAGPEVVALLPVHVTLLAAVGVAAGLVRQRTGSLTIPIGIHVGADIALYVGLACRAAPA